VPNVIVGVHRLWAVQHNLPRYHAASPDEIETAITEAVADCRTLPGLAFPPGRTRAPGVALRLE
jgi:hypothetical protein